MSNVQPNATSGVDEGVFILLQGASGTVSGAETTYWSAIGDAQSDTEASVAFALPFKCQVRMFGFEIPASANTLDVTLNVALRRTSVTLDTISVLATVDGQQASGTLNYSVDAGQGLKLQMVTAAGTGQALISNTWVLLQKVI